MARRVADQVGADDVETAPVQPYAQLIRHIADHIRPVPGVQAGGHRRGDIGVLQHELGGASVGSVLSLAE
jgi:hypothetical protein